MSNTPPPPPPPPPPMPPGGEFVPSGVPGGRPLAEPWVRILARFLDGLIVGVVINLIVVAIVVGGDSNVFTEGNASGGRVFLAAVVVLAISFLWDPYFTKTRGGTPMKLAFGMNVVRADDGGPVEWGHAIKRWGIVAIWGIIPILSLIVPLILVIVSLVFIFTKPLRQAVWDQVANTIVVKVR